MLHTTIKVAKWVSVPMLLAGGLFMQTAGHSELFLSIAVCLGAMVVVCMALRKKEYFLAAGFVSVALVFSPFLLLTKIFLLMTLAGIVTLVTLFAAFRPRAVAVQDEIQN